MLLLLVGAAISSAGDARPRTYYLSPAGDDAGAGTAAGAWRTFGRALHALAPGDTLVLLDGTYTRSTTGLPAVDCRSGGNAPSGTTSAPITLRAANERRAFLSSDGGQPALSMRGCAWWRVDGLRLANTDSAGAQAGGYPLWATGLDHVDFRRLLGSHNNRRQNTHVFAIEDSTHVLMEECEAYFFHRHAFSIWRSRWVTLRRCYANSMRYGTRGCCSAIDNRDYGDEAYSIYGTSDSVVENCVSENRANGFQIHGIANPLDPSGSGGRRNTVLGCLSLDDAVPALISSRVASGTYNNARDNEFRDFVAAGMDGNGIYVRGAAGTVIDHVTLVGSTSRSGLAVDAGDTEYGGTCAGGNPDGCSLRVTNVVAAGNADAGIHVEGVSDWSVDGAALVANHSAPVRPADALDEKSGRVRNLRTIAAADVGVAPGDCILMARPDGPLAHAATDGTALGARLDRRYVDGKRTDEALWNASTGAFPCGAVVAGVNDGPVSCRTLHTRLHVDDARCGLRTPPR